MGKVKPPAALLPSFEEAGDVGRIGIRVAGIVGRQRHIGAAQGQVWILTQTGRDFAGFGGDHVLLPGKKGGVLCAGLGDGLLQGQRDPRRLGT